MVGYMVLFSNKATAVISYHQDLHHSDVSGNKLGYDERVRTKVCYPLHNLLHDQYMADWWSCDPSEQGFGAPRASLAL